MHQPGFENPQRTHPLNGVGVKPPAHVPATIRTRMVAWAHWGVEQRAHFIYDELAGRPIMFNRKPGDLSRPIHADCSQFYAAICHWVGLLGLTDTDYTGTLLQKGQLVPLVGARPGDAVIFGPGTGTHAAMLTERDGKDWWIIGFGHQGAPDRGLLSGTEQWFVQHGHPGVRFLSFTP